MTFWGLNELFLGLRKGSKTVLGSIHVVEQLSFSMFPSILTFDFDLILGSFLTFWGPNGLFLDSMRDSKAVLEYTHIVEQNFPPTDRPTNLPLEAPPRSLKRPVGLKTGYKWPKVRLL